MLQTLSDQFQTLLGLGRDVGDVGAVQMVLRTIVIYAFSLVIVRLGSKRFLSEATAFDVIVGIMLGSIMSRAINGSAPFFPTLLGGLVLVGMHWLLGVLAYRASWFGTLVKGNPVLVIKDGNIQQQGMRRAALSDHDLGQALRLQAQATDPTNIKLAYLERNGAPSALSPASTNCVLSRCRLKMGCRRCGSHLNDQGRRGSSPWNHAATCWPGSNGDT